MKKNQLFFGSIKRFYLSIICIAGFLFFTQAQQPVPVIFKPLNPPITAVYSFQEAGLLAISNQHELQLFLVPIDKVDYYILQLLQFHFLQRLQIQVLYLLLQKLSEQNP